MNNNFDLSDRPQPDALLVQLADYVYNTNITSKLAYTTARHCLMDSLGCGMLALRFTECTKHLGPIVAGTQVPNGARVPGTKFVLDPVQAAFNLGTIIRWLDFNDTWLACEWGHPSDNLGGILATADYISRQNRSRGKPPLTIQEVLIAMIKAHEIQGVLALENSFNSIGLDHVVLVKLASTAVVSGMLGMNRDAIVDAISQALVDGQSLRTYRHAPNTGSRKSWAAGDATSRAVRLALITQMGEMGLPSVLTAKTWGFYDVLFNGKQFKLQRDFGSYIMENILFKISFPAEFHAQTAVEAAVSLHPKICSRLDDIQAIVITTHKSAIRIISKVGSLANPSDRDHCLQYMVACGLLFGDLTAEHYQDEIAADMRIDKLRDLMKIEEDANYNNEYHDPDKRSIANALEIVFKDGSTSGKIEIKYPIGHPRRREEGIPLLEEKFHRNIATRFPPEQAAKIATLCNDHTKLLATPVDEFVDLWVI